MPFLKKLGTICVWLLAALLIFFVALHLFIQPSNDRNWAKDQMVLPYAEFDGTEVTVRNIRNFTYASTTEYTPAYYDKTFDLDELETVDYIVEPFGGIGAAHTFLSFGFRDGSYLAISIEIRKQIGETFSPLKGFLRQYELMYVIADERDAVKLRSNYRKDDVYLYPVEATHEHVRTLFVDMLNRANTLTQKPEFYNTLTNNCTTNIADHINDISPSRISWDYRLLFPENSDRLAQELGLIAQHTSIEEARMQHRINEKAEKYADDPEFSKRIRESK